MVYIRDSNGLFINIVKIDSLFISPKVLTMYLAAQQFQLQQMWVCTSLFATNQVSKPLTAEKRSLSKLLLKCLSLYQESIVSTEKSNNSYSLAADNLQLSIGYTKCAPSHTHV